MFKSLPLILACIFATTAHASTLQGRDITGMATDINDPRTMFLYDSIANLTWYRNANAIGPLTWEAAKSWTESLNIGGITDWRLPNTTQPDATCSNSLEISAAFGSISYGYGCTGSEMGRLYYVNPGNTPNNFSNPGPFINFEDLYWTSNEYTPNPSEVWLFDFRDGSQLITYNMGLSKTNTLFALAVREGDIPAPNSLILVATGLISLRLVRQTSKIIKGS
jgi:hypothetical protein